MGEDYRLEKIQINDEWDNFVSASENGTVFSSSNYLLALNAKPVAYHCYKNETIKAGIILIEQDKGDSIIYHDYVIYNGILFNNPLKEQNNAQINSERFRISTFIAEVLPKIYDTVHLTFHPSIVDIRPFLWVNYGTKLPRYRISVRYTSYLNIENFHQAENLENINIYNEASYSRRQEIRYGIKKNVITREEFDSERFVQLYFKTMNRQEIVISNKTIEEMKFLITSLFEAKLCRMFVSYTSQEEPGSMAIFAIDNKRAYFLFGGNDPKMRNTHTGTMVLWDAFKFLSKAGVKEIDLEGINSPQRGWFKMSFGGNIIPYYQLSFKK